MKKQIVIFGGNSDIVKEFLKNNLKLYDFVLYSKNYKSLVEIKKNFNSNNYKIEINQLDLAKNFKLESLEENLIRSNILIYAAGILSINEKNNIEDLYYVNTISAIRIIEFFVNLKNINENYRQVIVLSSVAGERGRAKNYIYGSSKSALTQYMSGLRQKLNNQNIIISTLKLGYIESKMTKNELTPKFFKSKTNEAAKLLSDSIRLKKEIVYSKNYLIISFLLKFIPTFIFKKLKF